MVLGLELAAWLGAGDGYEEEAGDELEREEEVDEGFEMGERRAVGDFGYCDWLAFDWTI